MFLPAHCLYLFYTLQSRRDHQFNECSVEGRGERERRKAEQKETSDALACWEHDVYLPSMGARKVVAEIL